jgi:hypothetical protein
LNSDIYPVTWHPEVELSCYDRKVSTFESCSVEIFGDSLKEFQGAIPIYQFPSLHDAMSFQSSLRGKYLRKSFHANYISSKLGKIAFRETIKIWSDFDDKRRYLTFYQDMAEHKDDVKGHRDFPIDWFEPDLFRRTDSDKVVRINFLFTTEKKRRLSSWSITALNPIRRFSVSSTRSEAAAESSMSQGRVLKLWKLQ